jgi:shikimate kinase
MLLDAVDHRLRHALHAEWDRRLGEPIEGIPRGVTVVLAGHRAAGKSTVLPQVASQLQRQGIDLDVELERRYQRPLKPWVEVDVASFREAEAAVFASLPAGGVVAVGGGFLAHHASRLRGAVVVEVPVSFETYAERLQHDETRGRLYPSLSRDQELRRVFHERSALHAAAQPLSWVDFALKLRRPLRPGRVVTVPPGEDVIRFAERARSAGADWVEVRSDLHDVNVSLEPVAQVLPVLVSRRTEHVSPGWISAASMVDEPHDGNLTPSHLASFHSEAPLSTSAALAAWGHVGEGTRIKHVEPLTHPSEFRTLLATQEALMARFGQERVTVLATGPWALPFRAVLAQRNALDYLALDSHWAAAPGQRLLADARREARYAQRDGFTQRLGIVGGDVSRSRSPRIHPQPFDRINLPPDAPLGELLAALAPHYRGFAVTNPFKKPVALVASASRAAVNTLIRGTAWQSDNTDVAGAHAVLDVLAPQGVCTVLGDGGVTEALRQAAGSRKLPLNVIRTAMVSDEPVTGAVVWTWPPHLPVPDVLRFHQARVAVISYGPAGRSIAERIRQRGGQPLRLGPRWFIAQARLQRQLWEGAF